jgi:hypothetical protein
MVTYSNTLQTLLQVKESLGFLKELFVYKPNANLFLVYPNERLMTPYKWFFLKQQSRHQQSYRLYTHLQRVICYLSDRKWIGGVLTNWKYLRKLKKRFGRLQRQTTKTVARKVTFLAYINQLRYLPEVVIVLNTKHAAHLFKEAALLNIPTIGVLQAPRMSALLRDLITYPILASNVMVFNRIYFYSVLLFLREMYTHRFQAYHKALTGNPA